jgi:hypothetical protein
MENDELKRNASSNPPYISDTVYSDIEDRHHSIMSYDKVNEDSIDINSKGFIPTSDDTSIQPCFEAEAACSEFKLRLVRFLTGDGTPPSLQPLYHYNSPKIRRCVGTISCQAFPPSLSDAQTLVEAVLKFMCVP